VAAKVTALPVRPEMIVIVAADVAVAALKRTVVMFAALAGLAEDQVVVRRVVRRRLRVGDRFKEISRHRSLQSVSHRPWNA
jgi:hypothetical protein